MGLAHENGLRAIYQVAAIQGVGGFPTDYPPLALMILGVVARAGAAVGRTDFFALKISLLLTTLGCAWLMGILEERRPLLGAIAMFAALFVDSMLLVYLDVYVVFVFLLALICLKRGLLATGTALYTASIFVKWQPIILAPFILLYLFREPPRQTFAAGISTILPSAALLAVIYLLFGNAVFAAFWRGITDPSFSGSALNLNWLMTAAVQLKTGELARDGGVVHSVLIGGGYRTIGYVSYALRLITFFTTIAYFYYSKRQFADLLRASLVGFLCYFMFGSGVHENHEIMAAVLALCLAATTGVGKVQAAVLAVIANINLVVFFGLNGARTHFSRLLFGWDFTIYLALLNLLIFAVLWVPVAIPVWRHLAGTWRSPLRSRSFEETAAR